MATELPAIYVIASGLFRALLVNFITVAFLSILDNHVALITVYNFLILHNLHPFLLFLHNLLLTLPSLPLPLPLTPNTSQIHPLLLFIPPLFLSLNNSIFLNIFNHGLENSGGHFLVFREIYFIFLEVGEKGF